MTSRKVIKLKQGRYSFFSHVYIYLCGVLNKLRPDHPSSVGAYEEVRMLHVDLLKNGKCMNQIWFGSMLPVFVIFRIS